MRSWRAFSQDGRGLHEDLLQRVHRRGARFHGGIPCDLELADHLAGAVRGLGDGRRLPREQGPRRHLGVEGVGLAGGAACTAVAPIHFHDMMPGSVDGPCQASARSSRCLRSRTPQSARGSRPT